MSTARRLDQVNASSISRRIPGGLAAAVAATVLLTAACGPDKSGAAGTSASTATTPTKPAGNGIEAKSADEILSAATAAFAGAKSVHLKGTMVESGETTSLNLFLGAAGARGTVRAPIQKGKSVSISILSTKRNFYLKSPQMWRSVGGAQMADLIGDRWVLVPKKNNADFKDFERMTDLKKFADEVFKTDGTVVKGKRSVIDGVPAIGLRGADGTLYIATTGTPYPLKIVPKKPVKPGEELAFLDYDAPLNVTPPANVLDLNKLGQ